MYRMVMVTSDGTTSYRGSLSELADVIFAVSNVTTIVSVEITSVTSD